MSSPNIKASAQQKKDINRVLHTMIPNLPGPLVSFCLDCCFGSDKPTQAPQDRRRRTPASSASSSRNSSRSSSFDDGEPCHFALRRMDSGNLGQHSLSFPIPRRSDKRGFGNQPEQLTFDLMAAE